MVRVGTGGAFDATTGLRLASSRRAVDDVSYMGPRGKIQMNKQRHAPLTMYLAQVQADGGIKLISSFVDVDPGEQCPKG